MSYSSKPKRLTWGGEVGRPLENWKIKGHLLLAQLQIKSQSYIFLIARGAT